MKNKAQGKSPCLKITTNMYAIKWIRCTGETGTFEQKFRTEQKANEAACKLRCLDAMKGRKNECEYEIIKIGNSAK